MGKDIASADMQISWRTHNSRRGGAGRGRVAALKRCRSLDSANEGKGSGSDSHSVAVSEETANTITKANKQTSKQLVRQNCRPKNARAEQAEQTELTAFWFLVNGILLPAPIHVSLSLLGLIKMPRAIEWPM